MSPTKEQLKGWIDGSVRHPFYDKSVEYYNDLKVHAYGEYPEKLIDERRPTESPEIQKYRKKIFQSPTMGVMDKVYNSTTKIRKATDYSINFSMSEVPTSIAKGETLSDYTTINYPKYVSVDNWYWSVAHKQALVDSNAFVLVYPKEAVKSNEYVKPYTTIFNSPQVLDYINGEWVFLKSIEESFYSVGNTKQKGETYIYADKEVIITYKQKANNEYDIFEQPNVTGKLPIARMRGVVEKDTEEHTLYRSRIHSMLPHLNEAVREYSDLQGAVVQSVFPTYWYMQSDKCGKCHGTGSIPSAKGATGSKKCTSCGGKGEFPFNPFEHQRILVKQTELGKNPMPTPPGGIIEKDTKVIEIQDKRIDDHLYKALKAVNMEHLDSTPLNQSGTAKEWDRSEGNNFAYTIGEDAVALNDSIYSLTNDWRYKMVIKSDEERKKMLPVINTPVKFDIATDSAIAADIERMKNAKFNPVIVIQAEVEFSGRIFNANPLVKDKVQLMYELDPLAGKPADDILSEVMQGWISKEAGVIHSNIKEFVEQAIFENKDFAKWDLDKKKEKMKEYAKSFIKSNSMEAKVIDINTPLDNAAANN